MSGFVSTYRYGFNGKENDNEVKGNGNQQDYGMRIYDPRLGRFLSVDPITKDYPELTPYQFASNRPIDGIDWDGAETRSYLFKEGDKGVTLLSTVDWTDTERKCGPLGAGVEVSTILKNGEVKYVFVPDKTPKEKSFVEDAMDGPDKFGSYMEGAIRPGEKGLVKYANDIDDIGKGLKLTPLAPVGELLGVSSDLIKTGLDYKNLSKAEATKNLTIRLAAYGAGKVADKVIDKTKTDVDNTLPKIVGNPTGGENKAMEGVKFIVGEGIDQVKDKLTESEPPQK